MTRIEIMFNYNQAIRQAEKLESIAKKLNTLKDTKLENTLGTLKNAWQSDSSGQYYGKASQVQTEIGITAKNVYQIAQAIRTTAKAVKTAELRALEIARSRTYR